MKYLCLKSRLNEDGQAALEYVLVMVVVITIAIAFSSKVIKPMGAFIQDVMGTYVSCLLETGELPKLGNQETKKDSCSAVYNSAFGALKQGIKSGNFSKSNSSPNGNSNSDRSGSNSNKSKNLNNQNGSKSGSSGGDSSSYAGSASRGGSSKIPSRSGASSGGDGAGSQYEYQDSKIKSLPQRQGNSRSNNSFNRNSGSYGNQSKTVVINMQDLSEKDVAKLTGNKTSVKEISISGGESQSNAVKKKKITIQNRQSEVNAEDIEVEPIGFGDYARYLLIAAIIIALVVFIGGQAFQMSKEM